MMQIKEFDVILDIKTNRVKYRDTISGKTLNEIEVIKDDYKANKLNIYLEDGEKPYDIGENNAEVVFKKYDKTVVVMDSSSDGFEIQDNIIKAILSTNIISIPNRQVRAEVVVRGSNGEVLTTLANFYFRVKKGMLSDEIVKSFNELPILNRLIQQVEDLDDLLNQNEDNREIIFNQKLIEINNTYTELLSKIETLDVKISDVNSLIISINQTLVDIVNSYNSKILEVDNTKSSLVESVNNKINEINQLVNSVELAEQEREQYKVHVSDVEPTTYMFWYDVTDDGGIIRKGE